MTVRRFLKMVLVALAVLFAVLTVVGYLLPAEGKVARTRTMKVPAERLRPLLASFRQWQRWNPMQQQDAAITLSGPESGVGARQTFSGGHMEITRDDPGEIDYRLEIAPILFQIDGSFTLASAGSGAATTVTWTDAWRYRTLPWTRFFGLRMDAALGPEMDEGLANLEREAAAAR